MLTVEEGPHIGAHGSLDHVTSLVRLALHQVAYLRGMFPETHFRGVSLKHLDGLEFQMLEEGASLDARTFVRWVERGALDALRRRYLQSLRLGVAADEEAAEVLEEFAFAFRYDGGREDGAMAFSVQPPPAAGPGSGGRALPGPLGDPIEDVRCQAVVIVQKLIMMSSSFQDLPEERSIYMKLAFTEDCPKEYQPPFFRDTDEPEAGPAASSGGAILLRRRRTLAASLGCFASGPNSVDFAVATSLAGSSVIVEARDEPSLSELGGEADGRAPEAGEPARAPDGGADGPPRAPRPPEAVGGAESGGRHAAGAAPAPEPGPEIVSLEPEPARGDVRASPEPRAPAPAPRKRVSFGSSVQTQDSQFESELDQVRRYVLSRGCGKTSVAQAAAELPAVERPVVEACLHALEEEGLISCCSNADGSFSGEPESYIILEGGGQEAGHLRPLGTARMGKESVKNTTKIDVAGNGVPLDATNDDLQKGCSKSNRERDPNSCTDNLSQPKTKDHKGKKQKARSSPRAAKEGKKRTKSDVSPTSDQPPRNEKRIRTRAQTQEETTP